MHRLSPRKTRTILIVGSTAATIVAAVLVGKLLFFKSTMTPEVTIHTTPSLTKGSVKPIRPADLATAMAPALKERAIPTNTWWISALNQNFPEALITLPGIVQISEKGIAYGLPAFVYNPDYTIAQPQPDLQISFPDIKIVKTEVTAYDEAGPTLSLVSPESKSVASIRLVKGSPVQHITSNTRVKLSAGGAPKQMLTLPDGRTMIATRLVERSYRIYFSSKPTLQADGSYVMDTAGVVSLAALPNDLTNSEAFDALTAPQVTGITTSFTANDTGSTSTLTYQTTLGAIPLILLPNQQNTTTLSLPQLGSYQTIRGKAFLAGTKTIVSQFERLAATTKVTLPKEDAFFSKRELEGYLESATLENNNLTGSYWSGKELFKLANLYDLAMQNESDTAKIFADRLEKSLVNWFTAGSNEENQYFAFDETNGGLIAQTPEYGLETYNDHHFQYGYYIYAASVLAEYNPRFREEYGDMVNLIIKNIANTDTKNTDFPYLRVTDWYEGHSWAAGTARFADGNNQESVSEAINAWYSLVKWAIVTDDMQLKELGLWLLDQEVAASRMYYFNQGPETATFPASYNHHNVSLLWAGKTDWATWFSNEPEIKHGILYLPLTPASVYLAKGDLLAKEAAALTTELQGKPADDWLDILAMTQALRNPLEAQKTFSSITTLDSSNSRAYFYTWLAWAGQR